MPMNLDQWLERISTLHPRKWDLGLERVGEVGRRLGVVNPAPLVFLVAGTNGKGSTCEAISHLCQSRGLATGKSTSPHLIRFNERIVVNGEAASDREICDAFRAIDEARGDVSLSYFEFGALASLLIFKSRKVDAAVLEIGLGGRLDAMNIVSPNVSIITRVALDHQDWLGSDREQIGREKAGIMRSLTPCVISDHDPTASIIERARELGAPLSLIDREFGFGPEGCFVEANGLRKVEYKGQFSPRLPAESLLAAAQAMAVVGLPPTRNEIHDLMSRLDLAGRFQQLNEPHRTVLDVAHNPDAAQLLAARVAGLGPLRCRAVFGMYRDKDIKGVISPMLACVDDWYLCQAEEPRAMPVDELATCLSALGGSVAGSYARVSLAYDAALKHSDPEDLILVFGSFPIVGGVLDHLHVPVCKSGHNEQQART